MTLSAINQSVSAAPRSQVRASKVKSSRGLAFCLIYFLLLTMWFPSKGGEGSAIDMDGGGVGNLLTKTHVKEPRQISESHQTFVKSSNQKRSFRRALNRINTHGYTWYRGKLMSGKIETPPTVTGHQGNTDNTSSHGTQRRR